MYNLHKSSVTLKKISNLSPLNNTEGVKYIFKTVSEGWDSKIKTLVPLTNTKQ